MQLPGPLSKVKQVRFQKLFALLRKRKSAADDALAAEMHDAVFAQTDCLSCAQCCKNYSPILLETDIRRIARKEGISAAAFMSTYLLMDEEGDWVFHTTPCPFLQADNTCRIYAWRPRACSEYPHTNRKKLYQIADLTLKNAEICPAVTPILDRIAEKMQLS